MIESFTLFVSRDAMNIEGLSEPPWRKFIARGFTGMDEDLFHLDRHREEIQAMEGFGEKSLPEPGGEHGEGKSDYPSPSASTGLGIAEIGVANARMICRAFD